MLDRTPERPRVASSLWHLQPSRINRVVSVETRAATFSLALRAFSLGRGRAVVLRNAQRRLLAADFVSDSGRQLRALIPLLPPWCVRECVKAASVCLLARIAACSALFSGPIWFRLLSMPVVFLSAIARRRRKVSYFSESASLCLFVLLFACGPLCFLTPRGFCLLVVPRVRRHSKFRAALLCIGCGAV